MIPVALLLVSGCGGIQSTLNPAGRDAERIATLFWIMAGAGFLVWLFVVALAFYALRVRPEAHSRSVTRLLIIGGGAIFPTVVLAALLVFGLSMLPGITAPPPAGGLNISVSGEQFWWRIRYPLPGGDSVELANEIRIPVGEPTHLRLTSTDVIHSFWVPSLAGKIDMIPGRVNHITLRPQRSGTYRGVCAEYCGSSHTFMSFYVVVMERKAFDAWLQQQAAAARNPSGSLAMRGKDIFDANGCGACHTIRGTPTSGVIGPDLTHVGGRMSIGAGILPSEPQAFYRWIRATEAVKPGVHMPAFGMLPEADLRALVAYLNGLE